ncbi:hypothetical protein E3N88_06828 [Mikania micrantha]|uniref:Uncharacterized protein n=1 Tax=Mikania micrantha TaxID=192012 RepID=A0A5N6PQV8_9ASTR|nr:hypothetical protein E3N88_06828 [Mikania micrantha]
MGLGKRKKNRDDSKGAGFTTSMIRKQGGIGFDTRETKGLIGTGDSREETFSPSRKLAVNLLFTLVSSVLSIIVSFRSPDTDYWSQHKSHVYYSQRLAGSPESSDYLSH